MRKTEGPTLGKITGHTAVVGVYPAIHKMVQQECRGFIRKGITASGAKIGHYVHAYWRGRERSYAVPHGKHMAVQMPAAQAHIGILLQDMPKPFGVLVGFIHNAQCRQKWRMVRKHKGGSARLRCQRLFKPCGHRGIKMAGM